MDECNDSIDIKEEPFPPSDVEDESGGESQPINRAVMCSATPPTTTVDAVNTSKSTDSQMEIDSTIDANNLISGFITTQDNNSDCPSIESKDKEEANANISAPCQEETDRLVPVSLPQCPVTAVTTSSVEATASTSIGISAPSTPVTSPIPQSSHTPTVATSPALKPVTHRPQISVVSSEKLMPLLKIKQEPVEDVVAPKERSVSENVTSNNNAPPPEEDDDDYLNELEFLTADCFNKGDMNVVDSWTAEDETSSQDVPLASNQTSVSEKKKTSDSHKKSESTSQSKEKNPSQKRNEKSGQSKSSSQRERSPNKPRESPSKQEKSSSTSSSAKNSSQSSVQTKNVERNSKSDENTNKNEVPLPIPIVNIKQEPGSPRLAPLGKAKDSPQRNVAVAANADHAGPSTNTAASDKNKLNKVADSNENNKAAKNSKPSISNKKNESNMGASTSSKSNDRKTTSDSSRRKSKTPPERRKRSSKSPSGRRRKSSKSPKRTSRSPVRRRGERVSSEHRRRSNSPAARRRSSRSPQKVFKQSRSPVYRQTASPRRRVSISPDGHDSYSPRRRETLNDSSVNHRRLRRLMSISPDGASMHHRAPNSRSRTRSPPRKVYRRSYSRSPSLERLRQMRLGPRNVNRNDRSVTPLSSLSETSSGSPRRKRKPVALRRKRSRSTSSETEWRRARRYSRERERNRERERTVEMERQIHLPVVPEPSPVVTYSAAPVFYDQPNTATQSEQPYYGAPNMSVPPPLTTQPDINVPSMTNIYQQTYSGYPSYNYGGYQPDPTHGHYGVSTHPVPTPVAPNMVPQMVPPPTQMVPTPAQTVPTPVQMVPPPAQIFNMPGQVPFQQQQQPPVVVDIFAPATPPPSYNHQGNQPTPSHVSQGHQPSLQQAPRAQGKSTDVVAKNLPPTPAKKAPLAPQWFDPADIIKDRPSLRPITLTNLTPVPPVEEVITDSDDDSISGEEIKLSSYLEASMEAANGPRTASFQPAIMDDIENYIKRMESNPTVMQPYRFIVQQRPEKKQERAGTDNTISVSKIFPSPLLKQAEARLNFIVRPIDNRAVQINPKQKFTTALKKPKSILKQVAPPKPVMVSIGINTDPMPEPIIPPCLECTVRSNKNFMNRWTQTLPPVQHNVHVQAGHSLEFSHNPATFKRESNKHFGAAKGGFMEGIPSISIRRDELNVSRYLPEPPQAPSPPRLSSAPTFSSIMDPGPSFSSRAKEMLGPEQTFVPRAVERLGPEPSFASRARSGSGSGPSFVTRSGERFIGSEPNFVPRASERLGPIPNVRASERQSPEVILVSRACDRLGPQPSFSMRATERLGPDPRIEEGAMPFMHQGSPNNYYDEELYQQERSFRGRSREEPSFHGRQREDHSFHGRLREEPSFRSREMSVFHQNEDYHHPMDREEHSSDEEEPGYRQPMSRIYEDHDDRGEPDIRFVQYTGRF